ncbi:MAG: adenylosuccinate synthase [Gemmatimonadota bacterium]|nr:adenylosuccinate synthase [Gemmatimonadota bacterium]MDH3427892.1 adenylosuccinate synthase [Gemmatimonadota bacterium]
MFSESARCIVLVGAQWGDEGKGKITDVIAEQATIVARYQGGANAGHTVEVGEEQFILHLIPSGALYPSVRCLLGNGVVVDPWTLAEEVDMLEGRGIDISRRLGISWRAHLVLPYHKLLDGASETSGGVQIGTTRRGIGPAYRDKVARAGIRVCDLVDLSALRPMVVERCSWANSRLGAFGSDDRANATEIMDHLESVAPSLLTRAVDVGDEIRTALNARGRVLLEGAQGSLLDVDHGTYPFVTSSNTTAGGAAVGVGIGPTVIDEVLGVVKAYTTRVGNGPLPTELKGEEAENLRTLGGEYGATTGRPRRPGWFDGVVVRHAAAVNGLTALAVTKLDVLDSFDELKLGVAYEFDGADQGGFPARTTRLDRVVPVYETLPGWKRSTTDCRTMETLPEKARAYLRRVESVSGVPIRYVSVGSGRSQIITV